MVEYALLVSLIAIVSITAVNAMGSATADKFDTVAVSLGSSGDADSPGDSGSPEEPYDPNPPGDPHDPDETGDPHDPDEIGDPHDPADPGDPGDPSDPGDPGDPADPADPIDPGDPADEDTEPVEEPVVLGSTVANTSSDSDFYWWNSTKHGGEGAWKASASYQNDWIRHQYLTLEVTRVDDRGRETTTTVNGFYVPAGGSATYELWDNSLKVHKGKATGTVSVSVKVVAIQTSDEGWNTVSYTTEGPSSVVAAPTTP
jgi:Flp pilus assembly pilin Flp